MNNKENQKSNLIENKKKKVKDVKTGELNTNLMLYRKQKRKSVVISGCLFGAGTALFVFYLIGIIFSVAGAVESGNSGWLLTTIYILLMGKFIIFVCLALFATSLIFSLYAVRTRDERTGNSANALIVVNLTMIVAVILTFIFYTIKA